MAAPDGATAAAAVETPHSLLNLADPAFWDTDELEDRQRAARLVREYLAEQTKELRMTGCKLRSLPSELFELRDLEYLSVRANQLHTVPPGVARLTNLHTLVWSGNNLRELPGDVLAALTNLRKLDVSCTGLSALPSELFELRHLEDLNVRYNFLSMIPFGMMRLTTLRTLDWSYNNLREIFGDVLAALPNLRKLVLCHNNLSSLPPELFELRNLQMLDVHDNQLYAMPSEVAQLTNLHTLVWSCNELWELAGDALATLPNLRELDVHGNRLASLPAELFALRHLEKLDLSSCGVDDGLPMELWGMTTLTFLNISECGLTEIPRAVGNLSRLKYFNVLGNPVKKLPAELGLLPALNKFFAMHTGLEDVAEKHLADTGDYVKLLHHLRERAQRELSGRLTKRARTASDESEAGAGAGTSSKQEMSD